MKVDFLIIGQGLAGTLVAHQLLKEGKDFVVVDHPKENSSSRVAAGLYNPVTGKRIVKTWMADTIFPFLENYYKELEEFLSIQCLYKLPIFRPFENIEEQNSWYGQSSDPSYKHLIEVHKEVPYVEQYFVSPYGAMSSKMGGYVDVKTILNSFAAFLNAKGKLRSDEVNYQEIIVEKEKIQYKDIIARSVIFCDGVNGRENPLFNYLPLTATKGQIIDVTIENYTLSDIINKGIFVLPLKDKQRVGATYEWSFINEGVTEQGVEELRKRLSTLLKVPYSIVNNSAGVRPTVKDHRPLIGTHPKYKNIHLFNGLGTKGVSLAPYFSDMFIQYLVYDKRLLEEVDIKRFNYLYHNN